MSKAGRPRCGPRGALTLWIAHLNLSCIRGWFACWWACFSHQPRSGGHPRSLSQPLLLAVVLESAMRLARNISFFENSPLTDVTNAWGPPHILRGDFVGIYAKQRIQSFARLIQCASPTVSCLSRPNNRIPIRQESAVHPLLLTDGQPALAIVGRVSPQPYLK